MLRKFDREKNKGMESTFRLLFLVLTLLVLVTYLLSAKFLWDTNLEKTQSTLGYINRNLSQNTITTLNSHELMLRALGGELLFLQADKHPERGRRLIDQMLQTDPGMAGFGLVRTDGQIVLISGIPKGRKLPNLMQQEESRRSFQQVLQSHELQTGRAYYMKTLGQWLIPIRVPIYDKDHQLKFVMAAGYKIEGGTTSWAGQNLPDEVSITVLRHDGYVQYTYPLSAKQSYEAIYDNPWPKSFIQKYTQHPKGVDIYAKLPGKDDKHFLVAHENLKNNNLLVLTTIPLSSVISDWFKSLLLPTVWFVAYLLVSYLLFRYARDRQIRSNIELFTIGSFQQAILNGANYSIVTTTTDGIVSSFNKAAEKMLGYSAEEVVGKKSFLTLYLADEISQRAQILSAQYKRKVLPGFEVFTLPVSLGGKDESEWSYVRKDKTTLPSLLSMSAIYDENGQVTGYLGIASDITERNQAEYHLAQNEEKYRALFENSGDCIFLLSNGKFVDCNQEALNMFNCERDDIIGKSPMEFSPEYQPDGSKSEDESMRLIQAASSGKRLHFEWMHRRLDGTDFDAEVNLNVMHLGSEDMLLASVRDVSDRKLNERRINEYQRELQKRNENLRLTNELSIRLQGLDEIASIVDTTINILLTELNTPLIAFFKMDKPNNRLELLSQRGFEKELVDIGKSLPFENNPSGVALQEGRVFIVDDIEKQDTMNPELRNALGQNGFRCAAIIPLIYGSEPLGTISLLYKSMVDFDKQFIETMGMIGNTVSLAFINAQNLDNLRTQATHDTLTGLANRHLFHEKFEERILKRHEDTNPTLFLIDLDRFKEINDTLGHQTGDLLLKQIGPRLLEVISDNGLVSRLGGDEFAILMYELSEETEAFASRLQEAIRRSFNIDQMTLEIDCSIGIAEYPKHGRNSHDLLRSADVAMYVAKQSNLGFMVYDESLDFNTPERLAMISDLNRATKENQFVLHYQPKFDVNKSEIVAFEALVRWHHPERGLLYPDSFIHMAELSEVIHPMTECIIRSAVEQIQKWEKAGLQHTVAVNLSSRNLIDDRCMLFLKDILSQTKINPASLEIEITETMLMQDPEKSASILNRISELGIGISVDDFGTGYSSLAYLHRLPINTLKIDRTFVLDMNKNKHDFMIVRSTIELAHNLGLKVVAEGVEDMETMDILREMGCDQVQGYYISRPQPAQYFTPDIMSSINA
jgi:diguanylate cyclase (GGDEF)-like protein/PAS domain S-box-containing protein